MQDMEEQLKKDRDQSMYYSVLCNNVERNQITLLLFNSFYFYTFDKLES